MPAYSTTPLWRKLGLVEGAPLVLVNTTVHPLVDYWDEAPFSVSRRQDFFPGMPFVHLFVDQRADLSRLIGGLLGVVDPTGTVWVSWPKKAAKVPTDITEDTIREVVLPLGLVDVKVCSVTDLWSGLKLMVRKENRRDWNRLGPKRPQGVPKGPRPAHDETLPWYQEATMETRLDKGGFLRLVASDRTVVAARGGQYWLTRPGDPEDYLLVGGEALALRQGRWLVEALDGGTVSWTEVPAPQKLSNGGSWDEAHRLPALSGV